MEIVYNLRKYGNTIHLILDIVKIVIYSWNWIVFFAHVVMVGLKHDLDTQGDVGHIMNEWA